MRAKGSNVVSFRHGIKRLLERQEEKVEAEKHQAMCHMMCGDLTHEDLDRLEFAFDRRLELALRANRC